MSSTCKKRLFPALLALALILSLVMPMGVGGVASAAAGDTCTLVTNVSDLAVGDQVLIATLAAQADGSYYAMAPAIAGPNGTYMDQVPVADSGTSLTDQDGTQIITIEAGSTSGTFAFNLGSGNYLQDSNSGNYIAVGAAKFDWTVTIGADGAATIMSTVRTNNIRYNSGASRFSIYSQTSTVTGLIGIYKLSSSAAAKVATPTASPASGSVADNTTVTLSCATADAAIYYTADGSTPTTTSAAYSAPISLVFNDSNSITIKAIAIKAGMDDSAMATFTYDKDLGNISIADARAQGTGTATVVGVVTQSVQSSATNTTNCTVYIQDDTAGIAYFKSGNTLTTYPVGTKLLVTGTLSTYNGVLQIQGDATVLTDTLTPRTPEVITISQLNSGAFEGKLVKIENVQLSGTDSGNSNHTIEDASGNTAVIRAPFNGGTLSPDFADGDYITITGIAANNTPAGGATTMQLMVSGMDGISMGNAPAPGVETDGSATIARWDNASGTQPIPATDGEQAGVAGLTSNITTINSTANGSNIIGMLQGGYWQVQVDTTGFANITVDAAQRSSGTGPRDFKIQYSTDGTSWTDASVLPALVASAMTDRSTVTLPEGANNQPALYIRWTVSSNINANGAAGIGSAGTTQINGIIVNGEYILAENQLHAPVPSVADGGTVGAGQAITFTSPADELALAGYAVKVSTDGGTTWQTAAGGSWTVPADASFPYAITVKAAASAPAVDSREVTLTYTQAKAPMPVVTPSAGSYPEAQDVTFLTDGMPAGYVIYYTTDGTPATASSTQYTPGTVINTASFPFTINAIAAAPGYDQSDSLLATYRLLDLSAQHPYFGQLHAHTTYSDGAGSLIDALTYIGQIPASDNVDFVTFTDHSNYWDTTAAANPPAALNDPSLMTPASLATWITYKSDIAAFDNGTATSAGTVIPNTSGVFAMGGFEMTWSGGPGHINTWNSLGLVSRNNGALNNKTGDAGMQLYYQTIIQNTDPLANLSQFNHPGTTFGNFKDFAYYNPTYDSKMVAVEVGNGEGAIGSTGYFPSYEQYTLALDKGWHVGPTNNQDNHKGNWGNSNTARSVVYADGLTELDIMQGLKDKNMYATEDKNLVIDYILNGQRMGYQFDTVPTSLTFSITAKDPDSSDAIQTIDIVTNGGRVVQSNVVSSNNVVWNVTLTGSDVQPGYYYVRIREADKDLAVTAPVWVGQAVPVGINSLTASSPTAVTDAPTTMTVTLFNASGMPGTVDQIQWTVNGTVVQTDTPNSAIDGSAMPAFTYSFTPAAAGPVDVSVKATISVNGAPTDYTASMTLNAMDASNLNYIGIDGSHYNEYVNGNYKDSMTNFANMALQYGVRVVTLNTEDELIAATQDSHYKMLILTAPTRRLALSSMGGTFPDYPKDVIDAVAAFSAAGNIVVVTGWSNQYENVPVSAQAVPSTVLHMADEQNELLKAMGSTLRLSDDGMWLNDSTNTSLSSTTGQRFYLEDFLMNSQWFAGVTTTQDQPFSAYGASSIYAVDASGNPVSTLASNIQGLVFSDPSMVSVDFDRGNYNPDAVPPMKDPAPPKYTTVNGNTAYMNTAVETVTHANDITSLVIASGGAFMSNFEVQADANASIYSNYDFAVNLVKSIAPEAVVSSVAAAHKMPAGTQVTVEGWVTSNIQDTSDPNNTGFMDCIYVQDLTGGINVFPVSDSFPIDGGVSVGQKVQITGTITYYQGEVEITVTGGKLIDSDPANSPIEPTVLSTADTMSSGNTGLLVQTQGVVTQVHTDSTGNVDQFIFDDGTGPALVYINAYITPGIANTLSFVQVGATVNVIGLTSFGENFSSSDLLARIRVRDRAEITAVSTAPVAPPSGGVSTCVVTFNSNGGSAVPSQTIAQGSAPVIPTNLTKDGYTFAGWYTDAACTTPYDGSVLKTDTTLYAKWTETVVPPTTTVPDIFTTDHIAYVNGYPDGTFRPTASLTRAEAAEAIYRLLKDDLKTGTAPAKFSDVSADSWYGTAVDTLAQMDILKGYSDGTFRPDAPITRAEMAALVSRFGENTATTTASYSDVSSSHWAYNAIMSDTANGWLLGDGNGQFRPDDNINRAEFVTLMNRILDRQEQAATPNNVTFSDVPTSNWAYADIEEAANGHI